ncbi:MAG: energy-coupling factor ABC transporter ATP-binding protein [Bacillota bacterium]
MIKLNRVSFQYESGTEGMGLRNVSLHVKKGEVVLLCGESGCGKTTLTRLINGLIPHYHGGRLSGEIFMNGRDAGKMPLHETAKLVGSVFQNPRSQFFCVDTNSELAFGCENQGLPADEIVGRIDQTVSHLRIGDLLERSIFKLSGGEKQKIACGCVHTASPDIIVLDEPSSNLDVQSTGDLAQIIAHWKSEGKTVVIAEHRLYYLRDIADRMIFMRGGGIEKEFSMAEARRLMPSEMSEMGLRPLTLEGLTVPEKIKSGTPEQIELLDFRYAYKSGPRALDVGSLCVPKGQIIAVIGRNGAGKSTFARCLCGLNKGCGGKVRMCGRTYCQKQCLKNAYMVLQDVNHQLFTESVLEEVLLSMQEESLEKAEAILESLNLLAVKDLHPMSLSGGQKQRVAIASAIASQREIIVFDEPTSGLDLRHMEQVSASLMQLKAMGKTLIIISHDLELILKTCDYVLHVEGGMVKDAYGLNAAASGRLMGFFRPVKASAQGGIPVAARSAAL